MNVPPTKTRMSSTKPWGRSFLVAWLAVVLTLPAAAPAAEAVRAEGYLALLDEAEVPAEQPGVLESFAVPVRDAAGRVVSRREEVREGTEVAKGDAVAQLDDRQAVFAYQVAYAKHKAAELDASSDVGVRYAKKAAAVAWAQVKRDDEACRRHPEAVSATERDQHRLEAEKADLTGEQEELKQRVSKAQVEAAKGEADAAAHEVEKRQIKAPLNGLVIKRYPHAGEWLKPGDPVLHIIRMDRLRFQTYIDRAQCSPQEVPLGEASLRVTLAAGRTADVKAQIVFVSPVVEPRGFRVLAEVENRKADGHWLLSPGLRAEIEIVPKR